MATGWLLDADLAAIPIPPLIQRVRSIVSHVVHTERITTASATTAAGADSDQTLYGPDGQRTLLRPALRALRSDLRNKALAYACLINRLNYQREAARDPASAGVLSMRADLCEWLAKVAVDAHRRSIRHNRSLSRPVSGANGGSNVGNGLGIHAPLLNNPGSLSTNAAVSPPPQLRRHSSFYGAVEQRYPTVTVNPAANWSEVTPGNTDNSFQIIYQSGTPNIQVSSEKRPISSSESTTVSRSVPNTPDYSRANDTSAYKRSELNEERLYDYGHMNESLDHSSTSCDIERHDDENHASALEIAIKCDARRFCASPAVQRIVDRIWRGDVVFYANLIDDDNAIPGTGNYASIARARTAVNVRRSRPQGLREVFRVSRLRVPRYQHLMHICIYLIFIYIYARVLFENSPTFTVYEAIMGVLAAGFIFDELIQVYKSGPRFYVQHLWNPIDTLTHLNLLVFAGIRARVLLYSQTQWSAISYTLLACNAVLLWPRLLAVLDRYRWAGRRVAILRRLFRRVLVAATPVPFILIGFTHAFYALSNGNALPQDIIWTLLRAATGSPELGFANAAIYHPQFGSWLMLCYLFICVGSCLSILFAVSVHAYAESSPWSDIEYRFRYTVRVLEHFILSPRYYARTNRFLLRVLFCPILLTIYMYERVWRRRWTAFGGSVYGGGVGGSGYDDWIVATDETAGRLPSSRFVDTVAETALQDVEEADNACEQLTQLTGQMHALQAHCQQLEDKLDRLLSRLEK
ncbi:hypothetical protein BDF19DRAFT_421373 [Syncephalis fuscata]|nr:hypothetical protein BDF19DRAFT_421373 [Syncephalis fuscata]